MLRLLWPDTVDAPQLEDVQVTVYDAARPLPESFADADVFVVWGRPGRLHAADAALLRRVRLVQGLMAGTDDLVAAGFGEDVIISSGVGLHDVTVAEHAMALVLALVRRLPACLEAQRTHTWRRDFSGHQPLHPDGPITTLLDANVLIWGFGSIAHTVAPMLAALGATVRGVARRAGERAGCVIVTEADLDEELPRTDLLLSILPGGPATRNVIDARRLAQLPDHAYLVNVGRGSVLDEEALVDALRSGTLAGAALDVMQTEPLPPESTLWEAPNILLTPHCAGGRPVGYADLVRANVDALRRGGEVRNRV